MKSEIIFYQTPNGETKVDVLLENETVWLNQSQLETLFQTDRTSIVKHIRNIYEAGELSEVSTCAKIAQVQQEGNRKVSRNIKYYNLDLIISVGYRLQSHVATNFRIWATQLLREYIIKGFTLDDERIKVAGQLRYFDELTERIRDIRSSERIFYQKVKDIFCLSIDYDPKSDAAKSFFASVQKYMSDWSKKLNDILSLNGNEILNHAGKISHQLAIELAEQEYEKFNAERISIEDAKYIELLNLEIKQIK